MSKSRIKTTAVLNAFLQQYIDNGGWDSVGAILEATTKKTVNFLASSISSIGSGISGLFSSATSTSSIRTETKDSNIDTNKDKRIRDCEGFKGLFNYRINTLDECLNALISLGERATEVQGKYANKSNLLKYQGKSRFSDYLHDCRTYLLNYILNNDEYKTAYPEQLNKKDSARLAWFTGYEEQVKELARIGDPNSIEEALKEGFITVRPLVTASQVQLANAKIRRDALDQEFKKHYEKPLLELAFMGHLAAAKEASKRELLSMYTFPPSDLITPQFHEDKEIIKGIPYCFQPFFYLIHWSDLVREKVAKSSWEDHVILVENSVEMQISSTVAIASSTSASSSSNSEESSSSTSTANTSPTANSSLSSTSDASMSSTPIGSISSTVLDGASSNSASSSSVGSMSSTVLATISLTSGLITSSTTSESKVPISTLGTTRTPTPPNPAANKVDTPPVVSAKKNQTKRSAGVSTRGLLAAQPQINTTEAPVVVTGVSLTSK
jgi:hypothetical protein